MTKIRIGVDIDATLTCPTTFIPYLNKTFQRNLVLEDFLEYSIPKVLNITEHEFSKWLQDYEEEMCLSAKTAVYSVEILSKWKQSFNPELYYISAREPKLLDSTTTWFEKNNIPYDQILLLGSVNKLQVIRNKKINVFIEDRYETALLLASEIPVVLIDTPWNRIEMDQANLHRATDWREVDTIISRLFDLKIKLPYLD